MEIENVFHNSFIRSFKFNFILTIVVIVIVLNQGYVVLWAWQWTTVRENLGSKPDPAKLFLLINVAVSIC
jgi:hypothetical protein